MSLPKAEVFHGRQIGEGSVTATSIGLPLWACQTEATPFEYGEGRPEPFASVY